MREYELLIDEALKKGLSPETMTPANSQYLYKALGFRLGKFGLEKYTELENPLGVIDLHYSWPFPQMITGERYNILVVRDSFTDVDTVYVISDDHSTITQIFEIDALTFGIGELIEVADFGEFVLLSNGLMNIYWDTITSSWQGTLAYTNVPMMSTICNFKGQLVGGNVTSAWHDCDETFYVWSKIGNINCTPDLQNIAGYRRCPYGGVVKNVRRLGDHAVGYSDKGVTLLSPVTNPVTTFAFNEMYDSGIINKGALAGNLQEHLFVDEDYNLVKIVTNKPIEVLGYSNYIEQLSDEDIIVNFDKLSGDYFIGNSSKTFLLTSKGLTEIPQHPSTVWSRNKDSYMLPDLVDDFEPEIVTEHFNFEYSGQKTIATIESDATGCLGGSSAVDFKYDLNTWRYSGYKPVNNMGIASITKSGNLFRFRLKFTEIYESFRIGYLKIRYKMTDLRGIGGVQAPPPRGQ